MKLHMQIFLALIIFSISVNGQAIVPRVVQNNYVFDVGNVSLEVNPAFAGRLSSLKLNGKELMYINRNSNNWGSTFWTSPQSFWNWPPPADMDPNPYQAALTGNTLILKSAFTNSSAFRYEKRVSANLADTSISITFVIINNRTTAVSVAPWEITRFAGGGITFFPQRLPGQQVTGALGPLLRDAGGVSWFDFDSTRIPGDSKFFSDGTEGWLAHVRRTGELVLKKFTDSSPAQKAPNPENEIEHYVSLDKGYQEVEQQGAYKSLAPNESYEWTVKWLVRQVPSTIRLTSGNAALTNYARNVSNRVLAVEKLPFNSYRGKVVLFPNPAKKSLQIQCEENIDAGSLKINSVTGREMNFSGNSNAIGSTQDLDISLLSSGMYLLHFTVQSMPVVKEFIVE